MSYEKIATEAKILTWLGVDDTKLASLRSSGLPYIDLGDDERMYDFDSVADWLSDLEYYAGEHCVYFPVDWNGGRYSGYPVVTVGQSGDDDFGFQVPDDFGSLVSLKLVCIPEAGAAGSAKSFDLESNYGGIGETCTTHNETDSGSSQTLASGGDVFGELDISSVFTALSAGDICTVNVLHNSIGGNAHYIAVRLVYSKGPP